MQGVDTEVIAGTDHVGVRLALAAVDADVLGVRMETPRAIDNAELAAAATEEGMQSLDRQLGEPPMNWDDWDWEAETGLLHWLGIQRTGTVWRGGGVRYWEG